jgi:hypothetical protein
MAASLRLWALFLGVLVTYLSKDPSRPFRGRLRLSQAPSDGGSRLPFGFLKQTTHNTYSYGESRKQTKAREGEREKQAKTNRKEEKREQNDKVL